MKLGEHVAHVVVKIGKSRIDSVITRRSAEDLKRKKEDKVMVVIKSTESHVAEYRCADLLRGALPGNFLPLRFWST